LAKQLIHSQQYSVDIWTDQHLAYQQLLSQAQALQIRWLSSNPLEPLSFPRENFPQLRIIVGEPTAADIGDVIIEAFGSPPPESILSELARHEQSRPWIILDYLSAEHWVESHHLATSIEPSTGIKKRFFYPGFTEKTGGLIREEWLEAIATEHKRNDIEPNEGRKLFVFAYPHCPIAQLAKALSPIDGMDYVGTTLELAKALANIQPTAFVPQSDFDRVLLRYNWLFVRGEDSFVRAQYAGKPFVWNIYPTQDGAHWVKLRAFFDQYAAHLSSNARDALWQLWVCWNAQADDISANDSATDRLVNEQTSAKPAQMTGSRQTLAQCWANVLQFEQELQTNAIAWRRYLFSQSDLVTQLCELIRTEMKGA